MKKYLYVVFLGVLFFSNYVSITLNSYSIVIVNKHKEKVLNKLPINYAASKRFLRRFKDVAVHESNRAGVPVSFILGYSIYKTRLQTPKNNNFFGLKNKGKLKKYETAWSSWRDFSRLLNKKNVKGYDNTDLLRVFDIDVSDFNSIVKKLSLTQFDKSIVYK